MASRLLPLNRISPEVTSPGGISMRSTMAEAETDLPEPLSPKIASTSPLSRCQLTLFTALTSPVTV